MWQESCRLIQGDEPAHFSSSFYFSPLLFRTNSEYLVTFRDESTQTALPMYVPMTEERYDCFEQTDAVYKLVCCRMQTVLNYIVLRGLQNF